MMTRSECVRHDRAIRAVQEGLMNKDHEFVFIVHMQGL
jgi:hypothetical protein